MALTIRDKEVERLAEELARRTGESKTEAIRKALEMRLKALERGEDPLYRFLEEEVWPHIPPELRGKGISKEEMDEIWGE